MRFPFRRTSSLLTNPESLDDLKVYCEKVTGNAIKYLLRVQMVEDVRHVIVDATIRARIEQNVLQLSQAYPHHTVEVNLIDDLMMYRVDTKSPETVLVGPEENTYCRYVVAGGEQFEVSDSTESLIVCESPNVDSVKSYLGSPVVVNTHAVGALCVYSGTPYTWQDRDRTTVTECALAISHMLGEAVTKLRPAKD